MFFDGLCAFAGNIRFNEGRSLTQIFWRIVEAAAVKIASSGPDTTASASTPAAGATPRVDFVSPQLAAALAHPTRVSVMGVLIEGPASPRQMAEAIDEPLNNVTYHVKQLRELGCIELDRVERRSGGRVLERFYRASQRAYFDDDAWAVLSNQERSGVIWSILRLMSKDISTAMTAGTFFGQDYDVHTLRSPMTVDREGWEEITEILNQATKGLLEVEQRVEERRAEDGIEPDIHAKVQMMQFRSPASRPPADASS
jgi:DNA-binding transcriptional ArsR family regulator